MRPVNRADRPSEFTSNPPSVREWANQVFSRASGAPLREGNRICLLKDAAGNYPAWLNAIGSARETIDFEMYIIHEDSQGQLFADALLRQAAAGVRVRLLYDWMGGFGKTSARFWNRLRAGGIDVRRYNPPRFDRPLSWISRDHRKTIIVDRTIAFVTGLCVGRMWAGDPSRGVDPWRDTGIDMRGPAVADVEAAFAEAWAAAGGGPPDSPRRRIAAPAGDLPRRTRRPPQPESIGRCAAVQIEARSFHAEIGRCHEASEHGAIASAQLVRSASPLLRDVKAFLAAAATGELAHGPFTNLEASGPIGIAGRSQDPAGRPPHRGRRRWHPAHA